MMTPAQTFSDIFLFRHFQLKGLRVAKKQQKSRSTLNGRNTFSLGGHMLPHTLCPHWEQLKKDTGTQKKMLYGHKP